MIRISIIEFNWGNPSKLHFIATNQNLSIKHLNPLRHNQNVMNHETLSKK